MTNKQSRVHIVGGGLELGYSAMFVKYGWALAKSIEQADLVQFIGGEDVSPVLYNQHSHPKTSSNLLRDRREQIIFKIAREKSIPLAGICRGAQFLNVMMGGKLYQHVDGHCNGPHEARDIASRRTLKVTSTHHQMMVPNQDSKECEWLLTARVGTYRERMPRLTSHTKTPVRIHSPKHVPDCEAVVYLNSKVLCFQPHPEMAGYDEMTDLYFKYIERYLLGSK